MKLAGLGAPGAETLAAVDANGNYRDLSAGFRDLRPELLADPAPLLALDLNAFPLVQGNPRIGPCVGQVGKFICVGLNYSDHAAESGQPVPDEPILSMNATIAICGHNDNVRIPRGSQKTD